MKNIVMWIIRIVFIFLVFTEGTLWHKSLGKKKAKKVRNTASKDISEDDDIRTWKEYADYEVITTTDALREKMFQFIQPKYTRGTDSEIDYIEWNCGVYNSKAKLFLTYVRADRDDCTYIVIKDDDTAFYVVSTHKGDAILQMPAEYKKLETVIRAGILYYNKKIRFRGYKELYKDDPARKEQAEQIAAAMQDRARPSADIKSEKDAERLYQEHNRNYAYICHLYNKKTVADFKRFMPEEKMRRLYSEEYVEILNRILSFDEHSGHDEQPEHNELSEEERLKELNREYRKAEARFAEGVEDLYAELTLQAIKKGYEAGLTKIRLTELGYAAFVNKYIGSAIKTFPDRINELRPLADFIRQNIEEDRYVIKIAGREIEYYLDGKTEGFRIVRTTDAQREKMFAFLKPQCEGVVNYDVWNINWKTGAYDEISGIFLTLIYYVPDGISRCDIDFYSYIVLLDEGDIFKVENNYEYHYGAKKSGYAFKIPPEYEGLSDKVREGISCYEADRYNYESMLSEEDKTRLKQIDAEMDDRCRKSYSITKEEDAKQLMLEARFGEREIEESYNRATRKAFAHYATKENILKWRDEVYEEFLQKALHAGDKTACEKNFKQACTYFRGGVRDAREGLFLKVVKKLYQYGEPAIDAMDCLERHIDFYIKDCPEKRPEIRPLVEYLKTWEQNQAHDRGYPTRTRLYHTLEKAWLLLGDGGEQKGADEEPVADHARESAGQEKAAGETAAEPTEEASGEAAAELAEEAVGEPAVETRKRQMKC